MFIADDIIVQSIDKRASNGRPSYLRKTQLYIFQDCGISSDFRFDFYLKVHRTLKYYSFCAEWNVYWSGIYFR